MSNIDQKFVEFVVKSLVGKPDAVQIDRRIDEKGVLLELTVDPEDLGRVIGKRGATAQSLRTLLRALGTKNDARYNLKIVDNGVASSARTREETPADSANDSLRTTRTKKTTATKDTATPTESAESVKTPEAPKVSAPAPEAAQTAASKTPSETSSSDRLRQTREELADFDDLDI